MKAETKETEQKQKPKQSSGKSIIIDKDGLTETAISPNVMKETFRNLFVTDKKHLCDLGPFAPERMLHTQIVYAIYQPQSGIQVTLA